MKLIEEFLKQAKELGFNEENKTISNEEGIDFIAFLETTIEKNPYLFNILFFDDFSCGIITNKLSFTLFQLFLIHWDFICIVCGLH